MSDEKITPIPRMRGTPKRMRPRILRLSYYLLVVIGAVHLLTGLTLYYETSILIHSASSLSIQPPALAAVVEFFSGVFSLVAAFGLRRLEYWGVLSTAVFGVFEVSNGSLLAHIAQSELFITSGISLSDAVVSILSVTFQALGALIIILSGLSFLGIRRHRKIAREMKG